MDSVLRFAFVCVFLKEIKAKNPDTISVEIDSRHHLDTNFVQILDPPRTITYGDFLKIEYKCSKDRIIGVELTGVISKFQEIKLFRKAWKCSPSGTGYRQRLVLVSLRDSLAFRPDLFNHVSHPARVTRLKVWNLDAVWWPNARRFHNAYWRASVKAAYNVEFPPPYSRPSKAGVALCSRWPYEVISEILFKSIPQCPMESHAVEMLSFPYALRGKPYGVVRKLEPFKNPEMEQRRQKLFSSPRYTVVMYLFLELYCRTGLCSLFFQGTHTNTYLSPLIFINMKGRLHIQMSTKEDDTIAALTGFVVPKQQWVRIVVAFDDKEWTATLNSGKDFRETTVNTFRFDQELYYDDTQGLHVVGGMDSTPTVTGYMGKLTLYRATYLQADQIPLESYRHPMFELGLHVQQARCDDLFYWMRKRAKIHRTKKLLKWESHSCDWPPYTMFKGETTDKSTCDPSEEPVEASKKSLDAIIRKSLAQKSLLQHQAIRTELYDKAVKRMETSLKNIKRSIPLLEQCSCFGGLDAMFMLSMIQNNGLTVKADEQQSIRNLLTSCKRGHVASCLSLGHKHYNGLDGIPLDLEQSYSYFKYAADRYKVEMEEHKSSDVITEAVRLTDEAQLQEQTDENGDVFHWLKYQAEKGVFTAQQHVARALFWGSQGLKRNIRAAMEYYSSTAETEDPQAQYDYGIILLKGHGTEKNETEGLKHLRKSAEQNNPAALNTMGWYALNVDKNTTEAIRLFTLSYRRGNPDAAFNLGIMHLHGQMPNKPADADLALPYMNFAASRGQVDAGIVLGDIHIKGTNTQKRSPYDAVEWARFIAEKTPGLGIILRQGLHAYRKGNIHQAIMYYLLAAETGMEVATFNLAFLCEENKEGIVTSLQKECQWRNYNISIQRQPQFLDTYALIKMGDYYWYGCGGTRSTEQAAQMYAAAAAKRDPHALFNLGLMLESGTYLPSSILQRAGLRVQGASSNDTYSQLLLLYERCSKSPRTEAYVPCTIALYRVKLLKLYENHYFLFTVTMHIITAAMTLVGLVSLYNAVRRSRGDSHQQSDV